MLEREFDKLVYHFKTVMIAKAEIRTDIGRSKSVVDSSLVGIGQNFVRLGDLVPLKLEKRVHFCRLHGAELDKRQSKRTSSVSTPLFLSGWYLSESLR